MCLTLISLISFSLPFQVRTRLAKLAKSDNGKGELNTVMVDIQCSVWPMIGVSRDLGKKALEELNQAGSGGGGRFHGDTELFERMQTFAAVCG